MDRSFDTNVSALPVKCVFTHTRTHTPDGTTETVFNKMLTVTKMQPHEMKPHQEET